MKSISQYKLVNLFLFNDEEKLLLTGTRPQFVTWNRKINILASFLKKKKVQKNTIEIIYVSLSAVFVYLSFFSISINLWVCLSICLSVCMCVSLSLYISVFFFSFFFSLSFFSFIYKSIVLIPQRQANVDYVLESINIKKKKKTCLISLFKIHGLFSLYFSAKEKIISTTSLLRVSQCFNSSVIIKKKKKHEKQIVKCW